MSYLAQSQSGKENLLSDAIWAMSQANKEFLQFFFHYAFPKEKNTEVIGVDREENMKKGCRLDFRFITSKAVFYVESKINNRNLNINKYRDKDKISYFIINKVKELEDWNSFLWSDFASELQTRFTDDCIISLSYFIYSVTGQINETKEYKETNINPDLANAFVNFVNEKGVVFCNSNKNAVLKYNSKDKMICANMSKKDNSIFFIDKSSNNAFKKSNPPKGWYVSTTFKNYENDKQSCGINLRFNLANGWQIYFYVYRQKLLENRQNKLCYDFQYLQFLGRYFNDGKSIYVYFKVLNSAKIENAFQEFKKYFENEI